MTAIGPDQMVARPSLNCFQFSPLSFDTYTPVEVDTKIYAPLVAKCGISPSNLLTLTQYVPPFVDRNAPAAVVVRRTFFVAIKERISSPIVSLFNCFQFVPLFVDRNIPLDEVPAKIVSPLLNSVLTHCPNNELSFTCVQVVPLSDERNTPW